MIGMIGELKNEKQLKSEPKLIHVLFHKQRELFNDGTWLLLNIPFHKNMNYTVNQLDELYDEIYKFTNPNFPEIKVIPSLLS